MTAPLRRPPLPSSHRGGYKSNTNRRRKEEIVAEDNPAKETIGFIGVGRMGQPMASRLLAAGHPVVAYDIQGQALSAIAVKGATTATSPADVASRAEIVMVSLPMPAVVQEVALGA